MDWLTASDQVMRALSLRQAEEIEKVIDRAEEPAELRRDLPGDKGALRRLRALESMCEVTKTVGWLGPQLQGVLCDLGGTPAARRAMAALSLDDADPERLLALFVVFLYFWVQHSLWGQTPGKRLLRIRLISTRTTVRPTAGRTALRALIFPLLVFVPVAGPIALIVDGVWALLDPEGRTLHDRWANTDVTRKVSKVQAQM
ncbi:hypothetical protein GCM10017600_06300 [Streptosporangium carneum]|uniref:RDD family protein n=2 Tax=Streptosporangium carneum TaxID=47481 RepID=A0A9W6MAY8_9ACTN|nr:RDD family protein [Streptosporangium carneum]GLK07225.1 hypothetical protein GCM10017600_06300 [Streptosporangium carneum]